MKDATKKYLELIDHFHKNLEEVSIAELAPEPEHAAILSTDVTNAFCKTGNLASERVATIIDPIVNLFKLAWEHDLKSIILLQDCHSPNAKEFSAFAEHSVCGSKEAEAVDEIQALPFYDQMTIITKDSIDPSQNTDFDAWIDAHPDKKLFIVVGDCTDLCVYQLAIHLRTYANSRDLEWRVIVPEDCVDTYDLPIETAEEVGATPHPADLMHKLFLHHMALNGIEIVKKIK